MPVEPGPVVFSVVTGLVAGAGVLFVGFCWWMVTYFIHPIRPRREIAESFWLDCPLSRETPQRLSLQASDGSRISALWFAQEQPRAGAALVLCHGSTSYKEEMLKLASLAYAKGLPVALFDFRGHGESGGRSSTLGLDEGLDLAAVLAFVRQQPGIDPGRVGVLGHSMGAVTIINHLAHVDDETPFAFLLAPFATIDRALANRLRRMKIPENPTRKMMLQMTRARLQRDIYDNMPLNKIGSIRECRLCFIHGTADRGNNPQDSADLVAQAKVPCELHWIAGGNHHGLLQHPEVWGIVEDYLERTLVAWEQGTEMSEVPLPAEMPVMTARPAETAAA